MPAGDFSCADLVNVQIKAEQMWAEAAFKKEYQAQAVAAQAVLAEQTANVTPTENSEKDNIVTVYWVDDCSDTVGDCTDECTITGTEAQASCKDYEITLCREDTLVIKEKVFRNTALSFEEVLARQWARKIQKLDEDIAKTVVAKIDSFSGVNAYTGGIGTVVGTNTYIPASYWTPEIVAYLSQVAVLNKSSDAYLLDGDNLFQQEILAAFKQVQPGDAADLPMLQAFRKYFDLFNMNAVLAPDQKTFMIDKGAVAIASKNQYGSSPVTISNGANITRFSVPSINLPGIVYDVVYKTECSGSDIIHKYKFIARFDVFLNPASECDPDNTGVLSFICGEAP